MREFLFQIDKPVTFSMTGKFEAPYDHWMHDDMPLHDYELFVITEGTLYISYNKQDYSVSQGEMLLLSPVPEPNNRRKGFRPSGCSFYWLHFSCDTAPEGEGIKIPAKSKLTSPEKVIVLMKQLQDIIRSSYDSYARNYMTTTILCEIHNQFRIVKDLPSETLKNNVQIYHDIVDYIFERLTCELKVSEIAEHFGYHEKYLSHLFSSIAGISLKQFILKSKMDKANFLLTDTNLAIHEIAQELGFRDCHNFMKAYKKITGLTPSEYRNSFSKRLLFHK